MIEISLKAEELFRVGSMAITNSLLLGGVVFILLTALGIAFKRKLALVPAGAQNLVEFGLEGLLNLMDSVLNSRSKSEKYFPLVATIFLVVLISNWLGLLPGVGSIGIHVFHEGREVFVPLFRSPSADLNFTLALAIVAVFGVNLFGILAVGINQYRKRFFTFKHPLHTFVGLLEFVSELAKMVSFSFRLFGNIFAGEVLLVIVGFLVPYFIPLPFLLLEIFVGFIQAFVFAMLTLVFIAIATAESEH